MSFIQNRKMRAVFNWSGGKDSALCLYLVLQSSHCDVLYLLTSVSEKYQRVSMHGVRIELLQQQAESMGLPLIQIQLPDMPDMEAYDRVMFKALKDLKRKDVEVSIFGDIFLKDLRQYREAQLARVKLQALFPLWNLSTTDILDEFIDSGFKAIIVCVNEKYLDKSFAGRIIDRDFINDLPPGVDPCGENGEFHTFVFDGPLFKNPIRFKKGEVVYRRYARSGAEADENKGKEDDDPFDTGFWFIDLLPVAN